MRSSPESCSISTTVVPPRHKGTGGRSYLVRFLSRTWHCLLSVLPLKMETTFSLPFEILEHILSRLPVKTLLELRSVCKPWQSLISSPSFTKLYITRSTTSHRTALFISAYGTFTGKRYFLSTAHDSSGLITLKARSVTYIEATENEHLNGLILFTSGNGFINNNLVFVINPSMGKLYKVPGPAFVSIYTYGTVHICYFFGFDESRNEHKILNIRMLDISCLRPFKPTTIEIMIFSLSNYSWRKIDVDLPFDISGEQWYYGTKHSVSVNSVIHVMLQSQNKILAFDLRTEKFSIINLPCDVIPPEYYRQYIKIGLNMVMFNYPILMKINGLLGVVCHHRVMEFKEMNIWILQDYENRVWVRETITFIKLWFLLDSRLALHPKMRWPSMNIIKVPIYDREARSMKPVEINLGHQLLRSLARRNFTIRLYPLFVSFLIHNMSI